MFWFVLNNRSIGDETARCLPKVSHFDLAEIRPSIGFGYNAPQRGDHTTTCAPDQCLRGERGVVTGAKFLHHCPGSGGPGVCRTNGGGKRTAFPPLASTLAPVSAIS